MHRKQPKDRYEAFRIQNVEFHKLLDGYLTSSLKEERQLDFLLQYAKDFRNCKSVIIEKDYIDFDYQSQYAAAYAKSFKKFPTTCIRLHFFSTDIAEGIVNPSALPSSNFYEGYSIVTPILGASVGRTVLKPFDRKITPDLKATFCMGSFESHIFANTYITEGCPFISQDTLVMACAHSALWMASFLMHGRYGRYGIPRYYPPDMIRSAETVFDVSRPFPTEGLTAYGMTKVLSALGFAPLLHLEPEDQSVVQDELRWNPLSWILHYIRSGIPVLLLLKEIPHAVVVTGAILSANNRGYYRSSDAVIPEDEWLAALVVNDDQLGPYRIMPISDTTRRLFSTNRLADLLPEKTPLPSKWWANAEIYGFIVPVPREIVLPAKHLATLVNSILSRDSFFVQLMTAGLQGQPDKGSLTDLIKEFLEPFVSPGSFKRIVTRSFIMRTADFLSKVKKSGMSDQLVRQYTQLEYPLYIWVVEISSSKRFLASQDGDSAVIGELIFDTTINVKGRSLLTIHLPGMFAWRDVNLEVLQPRDQNGRPNPVSISDDRPHHSLCYEPSPA